MKGMRWMLVAGLAFLGCAVVALHLIDRWADGSIPSGRGGNGSQDGDAGLVAPLGQDPGDQAAPGGPVRPDQQRELALNECVERLARDRGVDEVKPVAPGRWPAIKRAREVRRLKRLQAREECEQQLAMGTP
jgi:hypothetical protein